MPRLIFQRLTLALFLLYLALFPGSTIVVALGQVPAWGAWMGGALLLLQATIVLCWLVGSHGRRGALVAALVFLLGWGVEQLGVTTGWPFGRYRYTGALQLRLPGAVPLAIPCAWLMVVLGSDHFRFWILDFGLYAPIKNLNAKIKSAFLVATLVLLLDLQIETVATGVNRYWVWLDGGLYYGVPMANFIAWWLVGLLMAALLGWVPRTKNKEQRTKSQAPHTGAIYCAPTQHATRNTHHASRITPHIPACLYLLNTLMFTTINLARGYTAAGLVGVVVLLATVFTLALAARRSRLVISG